MKKTLIYVLLLLAVAGALLGVWMQFNVMKNPEYEHHATIEMSVHFYAGWLLFILSGMFLFLVGSICALTLFLKFRESELLWKPLSAGMIAIGLVGLGEAADHLFEITGILYPALQQFETFLGGQLTHEFIHYIHTVSGPVAMFFFFIATREYTMQFQPEGKPIATPMVVGLLSAIPLSAFVLAILSVWWGMYFEMAILAGLLIPSVYLVVSIVKEAYKNRTGGERLMSGVLMTFLSLLSISVLFLGIDVLLWTGLLELQQANLYLVFHALQDVLHTMVGTIILTFTIMMRVVVD